MKHKFTFIDLFAGIGGMRIPLEELGGKCVFSSEIDKYCIQSYKANFEEEPHGDITQIDEKNIPKHNILVAGFPCQAFSHAGLKKGFQDTRGTLFFDIARILKHKKPEAFLLENVKGLRGHDKGKTLRIIIKTLNELGYQSINLEVLNSKNFGLPQNRERIFIVGFKKYLNFNFPQPLNKKTRLGTILHKNAARKLTISDKLWDSHQRRKQKNKDLGRGFGYSSFNRDAEYTSTISARYYKDGSEILIEQKNKNPRMLSPREAARLQGFPESFKIVVSNPQAYKQFGNSVSVPVIREIAKEMLSTLNIK